jgi:hypothetical protein
VLIATPTIKTEIMGSRTTTSIDNQVMVTTITIETMEIGIRPTKTTLPTNLGGAAIATVTGPITQG